MAPQPPSDPKADVTPDPTADVTPDPTADVTPDPKADMTPDPAADAGAQDRLLARARVLLAEEREQTLAALRDREADVAAIVAASEGSNADDEHDPEGATIAFERAQVDALARHALAHLEEVAAALRRVEDGSYGVCTVCGQPIPAERLEARPTATTHVACAG